MGLYLNPGNELFIETLNSEIYAYKSMLIAKINKLVRTPQKFVCVSRPTHNTHRTKSTETSTMCYN